MESTGTLSHLLFLPSVPYGWMDVTPPKKPHNGAMASPVRPVRQMLSAPISLPTCVCSNTWVPSPDSANIKSITYWFGALSAQARRDLPTQRASVTESPLRLHYSAGAERSEGHCCRYRQSSLSSISYFKPDGAAEPPLQASRCAHISNLAGSKLTFSLSMHIRVVSRGSGCVGRAAVAGALLTALLYAHAAAAGSKRSHTAICLNMIVKDEADGITEFLIRVAHHLSGWVICDTGSTDGTPDLIEAFFDNADMPGTLVHHKWTNFGVNRDACLKEAQRWSKENGGACDYYWFLDADEVHGGRAAPAAVGVLRLLRWACCACCGGRVLPAAVGVRCAHACSNPSTWTLFDQVEWQLLTPPPPGVFTPPPAPSQ